MIRKLTIFLLLSSSTAAAQPPAEDELAGDRRVEVEAEVPEQTGDYDPRDMRTTDFDEIARARFVVGQRLYEAGRFADAATEFERAFEISQRSSLLFNAYLAHRDAGNLSEAVRTLDAYLRETPDAADHAQLTNRLNAMQTTLAAQTRAETEANAAAQSERQRLRDEAETQRREADAQRARAEQAETRLSPVGIIVAGVGVGMLLAGGAMALVAKNRSDEIQQVCPTDRCPTVFDLEGERSRAQRAQRATDALVFGGAAVLAVGVVLAFTLRSKSEDSVATMAACTRDGCAVGARGSF